jgi:hypothetical protein
MNNELYDSNKNNKILNYISVFRLKRMEEDAEREREAKEEEERMAKQRAEVERERRRKEEYQRKLDDMKRKQAQVLHLKVQDTKTVKHKSFTLKFKTQRQ